MCSPIEGTYTNTALGVTLNISNADDSTGTISGTTLLTARSLTLTVAGIPLP